MKRQKVQMVFMIGLEFLNITAIVLALMKGFQMDEILCFELILLFVLLYYLCKKRNKQV